ncbi:MAG TPA: hypothetical protein VGR37_18695 [Longimicrobiaceae bacterium]|nr:hypothetical protein [Longimicrobiaceae bacterium]
MSPSTRGPVAAAFTRARTAMTIRRTAPLAALVAVLAAGCTGVVPEPAPPAPRAVPTLEGPVPPLPEDVARQPRPDAGIQGVYRLMQVNGSTLPAVVDRRGGCEVRAVHGTLSLEEGGFSFSGTTQEVCGATTRPPVAHRAEGRYARDGATVRFTAGAATAFGSATGQVLDERTLQVTDVTAGGRTRTLALEFRREDPRM